MKNEVLFIGRNGFNVATVTEDQNGELVFSYTIIPDSGYLAIHSIHPRNQDLIATCTRARKLGFKVEVPKPDYGMDFDFTPEEFREQMLALKPFMEGFTVCLDTSQVFRHQKPNGDPYCLIRMNDGTIAKALKPDGRGLTSYWPTEWDMTAFGVPENLLQRFRAQKERIEEKERHVHDIERSRIRARLHEFGIPFEEEEFEEEEK